jgi:hypothetical protein
MPTVPYNPVPDVAPQDNPIPQRRLDAPGAAFGTTIGAATEHLGDVTEGAGNEIFQRGMAMQDLYNHSQALDADTKFMDMAGDIHAKLTSMHGKEAVDYYANGFKQDLNDARQSVRDTLPNDMARKIYDQTSLSTLGRTIFNGAGVAGAANKDFYQESLYSQTQLDIKSLDDSPLDEGFAKTKTAKIASDTSSWAQSKYGAPADSSIVQNAVFTATSAAARQRIAAIDKTQPSVAMQMLQDHKNDLTQQDYDALDGMLNTKGTAVASANIATDIFNAHRLPDGTYDATVSQMQDEVKDKVKSQFPDNAVLPQAAVARLQGMINQDRYSTRQDALDTQQQIDKLIADNNVKDVQQLITLPGAADIVNKLPPDKKNGLQGYINRYNDSLNRVSDEDGKRIVNGIMSGDVERFVNLDLTDPQYHLNQKDITEFQKQQGILTKNPVNDPSVMHAQRDLRGAMGAQLQSLGIYSRTANNTDDYDHFTGALQEALTEWREDHKTPATTKDVIETIGPQIMSQQAVNKHYLWPNTSEPAFKQFTRPDINSVPESFKASVTADVVKQGGALPTDQQLYRAYTRQQFQKLYGNNSKAPQS